MKDGQKEGRASSGGQRIDDHSFWAGGKSKDSVFPMQAKMKQYESAEGAGSETEYEDTTAMIKKRQENGIAKAKSHSLKTTYRN